MTDGSDGSPADVERDAGAGADTGTGKDADAGKDVDPNTDTDADKDVDPNAGKNVDPNAGKDVDPNTDTGKTTDTHHPDTESMREPTDEAESETQTSRLNVSDVRGVLDRAGLAALVVLALIAGWSVYSQIGEVVRLWVAPAYQPLVLAAVNFAVVLVALAGITHQLRRIRAA